MSTQLFRASALSLALVLAAGCNKEADAPAVSAEVAKVAAQTPDGAVTANAALLKAGDFAGLMQNALPPAKYAELKAEWAKQNTEEPITEEDRVKFSALMTRLTAPDAENELFAEAGPKLKELEGQYQAQLPMYVNMGRGFAQNMIQQSQELNEAQKTQSVDVINAIGDWAQTAKFTDQDLLMQSIAIAVETARALNIKSIDEARALDFDASMKKGQIAFIGVKKILAVYGLSIDQTLDSVKPNVLSTTGDSAKLRIDYSLLGKPLSAESEMVLKDGHWYSKETLEKLTVPAAAPAAAGDAPAVTEPAKQG